MTAVTENGSTIRVAELPSAPNVVFRDSSFFQRNKCDLPTPERIREIDIEINDYRARSDRPPAIPFEDLGLVVKYGSVITIAEGQCLWYFNKYMKETVPTPEVFGWCQDGGETFIFMELIPGDTLDEVWPSLGQEDQDAICEQLKTCVQAWRGLRQDKEPYHLGHIGGQGVGDIIFSDAGFPNAGPFENVKQFHDLFARFSHRDRPDLEPRRIFDEMNGLADDVPIVFTHGDLDKSNIVIAPREGDSPPRLAAIIDWHQSGWYPRDWEWLKAEVLCQSVVVEGRYVRDTRWLSKFMDKADDDYRLSWYFVMSCMGF
ncbi:kinase-like domain-containing protein [Xylariaceae sp. FL1019]|nr:kinase-like domain-containing protein [Xylariaceae sp. FL1019]